MVKLDMKNVMFSIYAMRKIFWVVFLIFIHFYKVSCKQTVATAIVQQKVC